VKKLSAFLLALVFAITGLAPAEESDTAPLHDSFIKDGQLDLDAVVQHFEDLYRSESSTAECELVITQPRSTRTLRLDIWSRGRDKALIVITDPPKEKGTATLKVDRNLWNYLPRIKRTIRIPPSMMMASWMGSDFTNDDLVREASYSEDYTHELVGPSEDPEGWLIRFTAKPGIVGLWDRFEVVVSPDGRLPLRAEYYDRRGDLARTMVWDEVRVFDGREIPSRMTLLPTKDPGNKTEMIYHRLTFDTDVPESTFSLSELERAR
jgi:outer membrane lipoprotein-sorting protein